MLLRKSEPFLTSLSEDTLRGFEDLFEPVNRTLCVSGSLRIVLYNIDQPSQDREAGGAGLTVFYLRFCQHEFTLKQPSEKGRRTPSPRVLRSGLVLPFLRHKPWRSRIAKVERSKQSVESGKFGYGNNSRQFSAST